MNDPYDNAQTDKEALARYGESLTHAKTEHQPYAWAIATGHCPIINSTVRPPLGMVGRLLGIHAGKVAPPTPPWSALSASEVAALRGVYAPLTYDCGALIGVARVVGVVRQNINVSDQQARPGHHFQREIGRGGVWEHVHEELRQRIRPWWRGPWGWILEEAVLLPEPIPMRGQQGLWRIVPEICALGALEQWRKAREAQS